MNRMEIGSELGIVNDVDKVLADFTVSLRKGFSYSRLVRHLLDPRPETMCYEMELCQQLERQLGVKPEAEFGPGAVVLPMSLTPSGQRAGLDSKSGSAGSYTMATGVGDLIELLAEASLIVRLGGALLPVTRSTALPVLSSGTSSSWIAENPGTDLSDSNPVFAQRVVTPRHLMSTVTLSRTLLAQSAAETVLRQELARSAAFAIDRAAIRGTGTQNEPLGLLNQNITIVSVGTNGGLADFADILQLEYEATLNKPEENSSFAYLSTNAIRKLLRNTPEVASGQVMIWRPANSGAGAAVNGYPAHVSVHVPTDGVKGSSSNCHSIIFGDWAQIAIASFGAMALLVDRFAKKKQNLVEITTYTQADVLVKQPMFAAVKDATLS